MNIYNLKTIFLGDFHLNDDKNGKYKQGDWKIRKVVEIEKIDKNWVIVGILSNKYKKEKNSYAKSMHIYWSR